MHFLIFGKGARSRTLQISLGINKFIYSSSSDSGALISNSKPAVKN